jgi:hypothetical protein
LFEWRDEPPDVHYGNLGLQYLGPDGSATTYYSPGSPNTAAMPNPAYHTNQRYFRYKIILQSDSGNTSTPRVDDVVINWSP